MGLPTGILFIQFYEHGKPRFNINWAKKKELEEKPAPMPLTA
jgi:hypothetical protein